MIWLIPAAVTVALFIWAVTRRSEGAYDISPLLYLAVAVAGSLAAWLVWALLR